MTCSARPLQQVDPEDSSIMLGPVYDADGNVTSDTDLQNGDVTDYVYNARNELVETEQPDATQGDTNYGKTIVDDSPVGPVTTYAYNLRTETAPARPRRMDETTAWGYDADGNQTSMSCPTRPTGSRTAAARRRPTPMTWPEIR